MTTRNQVMDALVTLLQTMSTIKTIKRRYQDYATIPQSAELPFMSVTRPREKYPPRATKQLPAIRTFMVNLTIIIEAGNDQNSIPDQTVCDILDQLDQTLAPPIGSQAQTLGGLVDHCYIEGEVICVPGDLDGIGLIDVPLTIVLP